METPKGHETGRGPPLEDASPQEWALDLPAALGPAGSGGCCSREQVQGWGPGSQPCWTGPACPPWCHCSQVGVKGGTGLGEQHACHILCPPHSLTPLPQPVFLKDHEAGGRLGTSWGKPLEGLGGRPSGWSPGEEEEVARRTLVGRTVGLCVGWGPRGSWKEFPLAPCPPSLLPVAISLCDSLLVPAVPTGLILSRTPAVGRPLPPWSRD